MKFTCEKAVTGKEGTVSYILPALQSLVYVSKTKNRPTFLRRDLCPTTTELDGLGRRLLANKTLNINPDEN